MSVTVHLPEELAARLRAEASRLGADVNDVATALLVAGLDHADDPLEAFIGAGRSGRGDLARTHREILANAVAHSTARDV